MSAQPDDFPVIEEVEKHELAVQIRVRGAVQGVGFRPTVWRLARDEGLVGSVVNDGLGVLIEAQAETSSIERFLDRMESEAPPLSKIESIETRELPVPLIADEFQIGESAVGENRTRVTADASICRSCRAEILNPNERRFQYPFANCTHCGPRFSIVRSVPYDRSRTTMVDFPMCSDCMTEYENPADRRFHAQPIACATCGPKVWLETPVSDELDSERLTPTDALKETVQLLREGAILAIRGLGGFHLACDATNSTTVERLRARKKRFGKPFALMARDLETIRDHCLLSDIEAECLESAPAPIVLLQQKEESKLPDALAPGLSSLGFMLPYTPLHLLIMQNFEQPLVMTSGNLSSEPQVTMLEDARIQLRCIADAFLMHDREVANRIDDAVVQVVLDKPRVLRSGRGYAPSSTPLPAGFANAPDLLAYGGELKSTFCILKDGAAILSQHQGDLEDVATFDDFQHNLNLYREIYDHRPQILVADCHPEYLSTKLAKEAAANEELPLEEVQHHHAHVASCMAENGIPLDTKPILGVALDGLGFGDDGTIWGGEFLAADYTEYQRLGTFQPIAMIGSAQAIHEPWRNAYASIVSAIGWNEFSDRYSKLDIHQLFQQKPLAMLNQMLEQRINSPLASSCGRLFDAVAATTGVCDEYAAFEGQGAMELEALAWKWLKKSGGEGSPYPFMISSSGSPDLPFVDSKPMWANLLDDLISKSSTEQIAFKFHRGLANVITAMIERITPCFESELDSVALTGGCFQNTLLLELVSNDLEAIGFHCLTHSSVPANDGGLSLGQAVITAGRQIAVVGSKAR